MPQRSWLKRRVSRKSPELNQTLPYFPFRVLDLDKYDVDLPFIDRFLRQIHASFEDEKKIKYVVKLELIRAQIKMEIGEQTTPRILE